jgi:hypothetical protein
MRGKKANDEESSLPAPESNAFSARHHVIIIIVSIPKTRCRRGLPPGRRRLYHHKKTSNRAVFHSTHRVGIQLFCQSLMAGQHLFAILPLLQQ